MAKTRIARVALACLVSSALAFASPAAGRSAARDVSASATMNAVTLRWESPGGAPTVDLGTDPSYGLAVRLHGRGAARTVTISGLEPGTNYVYRISGGAHSGAATTGSFTTLPLGPASFAAQGEIVTSNGAPFFPLIDELFTPWTSCYDLAQAVSGLGNAFSLGVQRCGGVGADWRDAIAGRAYGLAPAGGAADDPEVGDPGMLGAFACCSTGEPPAKPSGWPAGRLYIAQFWPYGEAGVDPSTGLPAVLRNAYPSDIQSADAISTFVPTAGNRWFLAIPPVGLTSVFDAQQALLSKGKPVIQGFYITKPSDAYQSLTPSFLNAEVWLAIAGGAAGILYEGRLPEGADPNKPSGPGSIADLDPDMRREIDAISARTATLGPAIARRPVALDVPPGSPIRGSVRRYGGTEYVVVVNSASRALDATITLPGHPNGTASVPWEGRRVRVSDGVLRDSFPALSVHVYTLPFG